MLYVPYSVGYNNEMSDLFKSIKQGLNEAIEYERGNLPNVKIDKVVVTPINTYTGAKVKEIRQHINMTQRIFAEALGVSVKTVEAWEAGKNTPSGCASRMLELLEYDNKLLERCAIVARGN